MNLQRSIPQPARVTSRAPRAKAYNPNAVRRRIQPAGELPGSIHSFACYSMTREGREVKHVQEVDLETGAVQCGCQDFQYRHAKHRPTISDTAHHCKHLTRALGVLSRHDLLPVEKMPACPICGDCGGSHDETACEEAAYQDFDAWRAEYYSTEVCNYA